MLTQLLEILELFVPGLLLSLTCLEFVPELLSSELIPEEGLLGQGVFIQEIFYDNLIQLMNFRRQLLNLFFGFHYGERLCFDVDGLPLERVRFYGQAAPRV